MTLNAYQSIPAIRDGAIERLRRHAASAQLAPGPLAWDGSKGSLVGCILESDDLASWESELGLPQWLATAADGIAAQQESIDAALSFGVEVLDAVRPGADVSSAASGVILDALADAGSFVSVLADVPVELQQVLAMVEGLHRRVQAGDRPASAEWRAARRDATALTDAQPSELLKALSTCAETAAWDPTSSKAVVFDTLRVYSRAAIQKADAESGYTKDDDDQIRVHLELMWNTYLVDQPELQEQGVTVFSLLEEHHPEIAATLRNKNRMDQAAYTASNRRAAEVLVAQLKRV
jgi:hypothetical protein